ncbi:outer membrane beta-barrel protein [Leptolyngbya ohadii]|uniref:outer membrane beta-barrel protein n=1 Tax=Leptolyngbya ohadii TaxID=1962290 RepID=UPI00117BB108|nr:outer membrane beta-barrel protein [Leptolyngbya ohadii]
MSYSILWMGCLWSHSQDASAETLAAQANSASRSRSNETAQADRPSIAQSDRASIQSLWTANIAPAELSLPPRIASSVSYSAAQSHPTASRFTDRQRLRETALEEVSRLIDRQSQTVEVQAPKASSDFRQSSVRSSVPPLFAEVAIGESIESDINQIAPIALIAQNRPIDQAEGTSPATDSQTIDPELGELRLRDTDAIEQPTEQSAEQSSADATADPELGRLRLRDRPPLQPPAAQQPPPAEPQTVFLLGSIDYFRSDNILADDLDPVDDQIITVGASLLAIPRLGSRTQLVASAGANLARYSDLTELNYSNIQLRLGIRQNLFPRTFGELSWTNQQFFSSGDGDRFLNDHALRLSLWRRDPIVPRLNLDTFYQFRLSFTDPIDRSRLSNTLGAYLNYELQQNLEVGLDYQFSLTHFTQQEREDSYHQLTAQLSYDLSRESRISLYGGFSFGRSSESSINFNSGILGVSLSANLALF